MRNSHGVELSANGYVLCSICGKEVQEISKETALPYDQCPQHSRAQPKGDLMPAVPKPSASRKQRRTASRQKPSRTRSRKTRTASRPAKPMRPPAVLENKGGKSGAVIQLARERGGLSRAEIIAESEKLGLKGSSCVLVAGYCKKLGLLKTEG